MQDRTDERSPRRELLLVLWLALAAVQIVAQFALGGGDEGDADQPIYDYALGINAIILYAVFVVLTTALASLHPDRRTALGLVPFTARSIGLAVGVVIAATIVSSVLEPFLHAGEEQGLAPQTWQPDRAGAFVFNAIVIVTVVPFAEELFYRGLGVTALAPLGVPASIAGTAVMFGFAHGILVALPPLVLFGLGLAWVRVRSASVWPGVIAHGAYNALALAVSLAAT